MPFHCAFAGRNSCNDASGNGYASYAALIHHTLLYHPSGPARGTRPHHRQSQCWHMEIESYTQMIGKPPALEDYNDKIEPWSLMHQSTERYLAKKKNAKPGMNRDERLRLLILLHGRKDIAITACGYAMSANALADLICSREFADITSLEGLKPFLQCTHAVSLVSDIITTKDGLKALRMSETAIKAESSYLKQLLDLLPLFSSRTLLYERIYARVELEWEKLVIYSEGWKANRRWLQAYTRVKWLSTFERFVDPSNTQQCRMQSILDVKLSQWRAWAGWRPNIDRIARWDKFSDYLCEKLGNILDLDGPDFDLYYKTHGKSLANHLLPINDKSPLRFNGSTIDECRDMAERLLCLLDNIVTSRSHDIDLFLHVLTGPKITEGKLQLLEKLMREDVNLTLTITQAFSLNGWRRQSEAVKELLPLLNSEKLAGIRDVFVSYFAPLMTDLIREERLHVIEEIQSSQACEPTFARYDALHSDLLQASWLWPFLEEPLPKFMETWHGTEELKLLRDIYLGLAKAHIQLETIRAKVPGLDRGFPPPKTGVVELISCYVLESPNYFNAGMRTLMKALMSFWRISTDPIRQGVALWLIPEAGPIANIHLCIEQLPILSNPHVTALWAIISCYDIAPNQTCLSMVKFLAREISTADISCWRSVLHRMVVGQGDKFVEYVLKKLAAQKWIEFLDDIQSLYGKSERKSNSAYCLAGVPQPPLLEWGRKLLPYTSLIDDLKEKLDSLGPIRCLCFEAVGRIHLQETVERLLDLLQQRPPGVEEEDTLMQINILNHLAWNGGNMGEVLKTLDALYSLSADGYRVCIRVEDLLETTSSQYIARAFLEALLTDPVIDTSDARALKTIFKSLDASTDLSDTWLRESHLGIAHAHMEAEYAGLLDEARRLAALKASLKSVDPQGITKLLASIDIEDCPLVEDVLASLPEEVVNAVEVVSHERVEILFPLTNLTQLQRKALGIGTAQSFVLFLELCNHKAHPGRFCIHLDTDSRTNNDTLNSSGTLDINIINICRFIDETSTPTCTSGSSPFKYHFTKMLRHHLIEDNLGQDFSSLSSLHQLISHYLKNIGAYCSQCGTILSVNLRKPTTCDSSVCTSLTRFLNSHTQRSDLVQLSGVLQDQLATDLLISSVYAAIKTNKAELFPNNPVKDINRIPMHLDSLPSTSSIAKDPNPSSSLLLREPLAMTLVIYALTTHRSFITSATGALKVPSMPPGTLQFVVANTSPEREAAFQAEIDAYPPNTPTRILFHGTTPDRLFAILCQGLKILSNTPLQAHGAAYGRGIYMADEPITAWGFCKQGFVKNWKRSALDKNEGYKVLLGCEQAGPRLVEGEHKIHVVTNEKTLMLRYIFLIPGKTDKVPVARHLVPAMMSVCKGLRAGTL